MSTPYPADRAADREPRQAESKPNWLTLIGLLGALSSFLLSGCGGGGQDGTPGGSVGTGTGAASLSWDAPTTSADGSALSDLAGFKIYYGVTSPIQTSNQSLDVGDTTTYALSGLDTGTYYFAIAAYDTSGNESVLSDEVSKVVSGT